jgi:hypothetical protein
MGALVVVCGIVSYWAKSNAAFLKKEKTEQRDTAQKGIISGLQSRLSDYETAAIPRSLNRNEQKALTESTRTFGPQPIDIYIFPTSATDVSPLAREIFKSLLDAGMQVRTLSDTTGRSAKGVWISVKPNADQTTEALAVAITRGLERASIVRDDTAFNTTLAGQWAIADPTKRTQAGLLGRGGKSAVIEIFIGARTN